MKQTTMYYGKEYGLVYSSLSEKEVNVYAHMLTLIIKEDLPSRDALGHFIDKSKIIPGMVLFINHQETTVKGKPVVKHEIYIKKPYDKLVWGIK